MTGFLGQGKSGRMAEVSLLSATCSNQQCTSTTGPACMVKKTSSMTMPTMKGRRLVTPPLGGWMNMAPASRAGGAPRGTLTTSNHNLSFDSATDVLRTAL